MDEEKIKGNVKNVLTFIAAKCHYFLSTITFSYVYVFRLCIISE